MQTTVKNCERFVAANHDVGWQGDFFDHRLRNHHELEEKTSYILMNPVRKGLCEVGQVVLSTSAQSPLTAARTE